MRISQSDAPVVSALMPTYQMADVIGEAIVAILEQTMSDWELIIVDDGSTDGTADVVEQFSDRRIKYVWQANGGRGAARNAALEQSRGRYLAICDADDISLPERFELQSSYLDAHGEVAAVGGGILHFDDLRPPRHLAEYPVSWGDIKAKFDKGVMGIPHCAAMMRAGVVQQLGGYSVQCRRAQDLELCLRMYRRGYMANLPQTLVLYRNSPQSLGLRGWTRLHLYHEYARYRSRVLELGQQPADFRDWRFTPRGLVKVYTWHLARWTKSRVVLWSSDRML